MEVQHVPTIVQIAKKNNVKTVIDNAWATPLFFKPHSFGVDISIEAATKYIGGHSDLLLGLVTANEENWPLLKSTYSSLDMLPGAEDCHLALRSLRTFHLRVKEAERKALKVANGSKREKRSIRCCILLLKIARVMNPGSETSGGRPVCLPSCSRTSIRRLPSRKC